MFRTSKCSSSGRLVHAILWYFFHASISAVWSMADLELVFIDLVTSEI